MLGWFSWIKMIFDFIKRIFGLVDEGPRKRGADQLDEIPVAFGSPKKHCCGVNRTRKDRIVYADENVEEEAEYLGESHYPPARSKDRLNGASCIKRKRSTSFQPSAQQIYPKQSASKMNGEESKLEGFSMKSMNAMTNWNCKYSALGKSNQLREKQEYGQLLQNFLPQRIQVIRNKTELDTKKQTITEVIDLEKYETPSKHSPKRSSCDQKSRDIYFTPKTSTPLKWYTPREPTNLEPVRARAKDKEISIIGSRRLSKETIENEKSSTRSTIRRDSDNSKIAEVVPVIIVEEVVDDGTSPLPRRIVVDESEASTSKTEELDRVEIVATNTLRDNLAAKAVMKHDFVPRITGHYNERYEQRLKEAEEIKRITCMLSKHNRLAREAALETQLARSMRLHEAVLDETADLEDEALPTLTPAMLQDIKNALVSQPANEVLVEGFGLRITRKDIHTLVGLNWLNDEVINFYMNLLISRGTSGDRYPKVHAMNTFFYPKLLSGGHSSLKRWTRKIDVFAQDLLVVPIHLGIHWCMSIIDFRDKSIRYFDSMGGANPKCLSTLRRYLQDESMDKKKKPFDMNDWKLESVTRIPQQMNGSDCGVFSCMFAEFICANRKITFTQEDMPYFRKKMVYEILKAKLL